MVIHEMTVEECREVLAHTSLARLACEMDGQPYVVPLYLVYDGNCLFGFSTMGYKIDCMRTNPNVCVEIDDIESQNQWVSVVVSGSFEELPDTQEYEAARVHAHDLLQRRAMWWEPATVTAEHRGYPRLFAPIFYRIHIDKMTGHRASPDPVQASPARPIKDRSWFGKLLDRVLHG